MATPISKNFLNAIEEINHQFVEAFEHDSPFEAANVYADDAELDPPNEKSIEGKAAIQIFWKHVMDAGIRHAHLKTIELEPHGNTAIEAGEYRLEKADGSLFDEGKYVVIWKRVGGGWKWQRDIWNSSLPLK